MVNLFKTLKMNLSAITVNTKEVNMSSLLVKSHQMSLLNSMKQTRPIWAAHLTMCGLHRTPLMLQLPVCKLTLQKIMLKWMINLLSRIDNCRVEATTWLKER